MKNILPLALLLALSTGAHAATATYLVAFFDSQTNAYSGDASSDFGVTVPYSVVGGSTQLATVPAGQSGTDTYSLGAATLTLNSPYGSYRVKSPGDTTPATPAYQLTGGFLFAKNGVTPTTLTLTGIAPGSSSGASFEVDDLVAMRARLAARGVSITDVHESPVCYFAFASDPDGNGFGIHQRKARPADADEPA